MCMMCSKPNSETLRFAAVHACMLSHFAHVWHFETPSILPARILEWVTMLSSRRASQQRGQIHVSYVSCISGGFITTEPPGKPEVCSRERIYTPSTRVIYTLTLWVRRQENKSQIYLPEGERLRTFMGKAEEWGVRGKLTGNKQVSWSSFYTGATKLNASLQGERLEKCPEDGVFGPLMLKGHQGHSGMSRWRAGGPVLTGWSSD